MEGHVNLMNDVRSFYRQSVHRYRGASANIEIDASNLVFDDNIVRLSDSDAKSSVKKVVEVLKTRHDQQLQPEVEEQVCVKIDMNRGFTLDEFPILQLSTDLPQQFRQARERFSFEFPASVEFPMAGKLELTQKNSLPASAEKQVLKEVTMDMVVTIETKFTGYLLVGRKAISVADVIVWKRQQMLAAAGSGRFMTSSVGAAERYLANGKFRSFGRCTLFWRQLVPRGDATD